MNTFLGTIASHLLPSLGRSSGRQIDDIFSYISQKVGFDIPCKLSKETIFHANCLRRQFAWTSKPIFQGLSKVSGKTPSFTDVQFQYYLQKQIETKKDRKHKVIFKHTKR